MNDFGDLKAKLEAATARINHSVEEQLPLANAYDHEAATRGKIADLPKGGIDNAHGAKAWDMSKYDFLQGPCPGTVNPSLWRMGQLNTISGLFEITEGVWQARGFDYANMTIVRGETGWILVDPLMTVETSAAALKVVNETLGHRPVTAVLITHTHPDHFGGLRGVIDAADPPPIYAPEHFMDFAASEGILGGNQMARRAMYQFGIPLAPGPDGAIDGGIGKTVGRGQRTFVEPSEFIGQTGETRTIDGVRFTFQMASGTEAPAEFTFLLPDHRVLCMAEVCTQTMHNILPPRGAEVRDALLWARCIDEAITLFAEQADTLINSHNWPVWGQDDLRTFMEEQRDIYKYTHDQTLRLANLGHTPHEIAALIEEPDWLSTKFHSRGYYGDLKFNARAVYQGYFGFYDGNPVNADPLSPDNHGRKFVAAVGGTDAAMNLACSAIEDDDLQWASTILSHLVFSGVDSARPLHALVLRHQGFRQESGIQRNLYLTGAKELEGGVTPIPVAGGRNADLAATLKPQDWFDAYALRLSPARARGVKMALNIAIDDQIIAITIDRQTEFARIGHRRPEPNVEVTTSLLQLERLTNGSLSIETALDEGLMLAGDTHAFQKWLSLHDTFDLWFNVVTP